MGLQGLYSNTTGADNVGIGYEALYYNTTNSNNVALGDYALFNSKAAGNTALGYQALQGQNGLSTGGYNVAVGQGALSLNTTGSNNVAIGGATGLFHATYTLGENTTGADNTAVGSGALFSNTTSGSNTAIGASALESSTGGNNTGLGYLAGNGLTTGSSDTFIGYDAIPQSGSLTNATAIGANSTVSQNNALVLGGISSSAVNVGVGTTTPNATLTINQTGASYDIFTASVSGTTEFRITNSGDLVSVAGASWQPLSDSTTALNIANAAGTSFATFDTTDKSFKMESSGNGTQNPLQNTGISTPDCITSFDYNMGYKFTPNVNGDVTQLGLRADSGTRTVRLYDSLGNVLASASVTANGASNWVYASISPVFLKSGSVYYVAQESGTNHYCYLSYTTPVTQGDITINSSWYSASSGGPPGTTDTGYMWGYADITFNPIMFTVNSTGQVGIGRTPSFMLDVADSQTATATAFFRNEDGRTTDEMSVLALQLGQTTPSTTNYWMAFLNGNGAILGKIRGNGTSNTVTYDANGGDYAEYYKKADPSESISAGDLVCLSAKGGVTKCSGDSGSILGIVSSNAGFVGVGNHTDDPNYVLVGLVGQLPVKIASDSGIINPSDPLTASSTTAGTVEKATKVGVIVGRALGTYNPATDTTGEVMVSLNQTWYDPSVYLTSNGGLATTATPSASQVASSLGINTSATTSATITPAPTPVSTSSASFDLATNPDFIDLKDRVASAEAQIVDLKTMILDSSSQSAFMQSVLAASASNAASQSALGSDLANINAQNATISGSLMVLGRTTLGDLGITGNIASGLLSIHGMDTSLNNGNGGASINSVGDLNLQSNQLGGINILAGEVTIDTKGNIKTQGEITTTKINIDTASNPASPSLGSGLIGAGKTSVDISTAAVTANSKIFVTATSKTGGQELIVSKKSAGTGFTVEVEHPYAQDIKFDWWIVDEKK